MELLCKNIINNSGKKKSNRKMPGSEIFLKDRFGRS